MKKSMLLVLLLSPILLFPQKMSTEAQEFKDIVMKYAYQYLSPMQIKVLEENYCGPDDCYKSIRNRNTRTGEGDYIPWNREVSDEIVIRALEVVVHESTHKFNPRDKRFVVSETEFIEIEKTEVIRTSLITNDMIDRNPIIEDISLFHTYVNVDYDYYLGSNIGGIYGLMDEYCAYYNGVSAAFILYKVFKNKQESITNDSIAEWYKDRKEDVGLDALGHMSAFYEFNSFISAYLMYVRENNYEIYDDIMNNTEFLRAYSMVTLNYKELADEIQEEFPDNKIIIYKSETASVTRGANIDFEEVMAVYNDYIPFLEKLQNIANNQILTKK